ncbi:MAG: molybdopterin dehydrogenase [Verrucomicrobia bacterium]|nr:MAG: molybdopterin dehydrogenase [Verrucomicrobiota bacterium]
MKSFEYAAPKTLKEAAELLGDKWGETEILAGGTDLITSLKQNITEPKRVVSLRNIAELKGVEIEQKGLRIGAMTTLAELAGNKNIKEHFPSLVTAANGVGSPQLLSVGTVGGDLCQRPRCWYFRNGFGLFAQHEGVSLVREGDNRYHALFANEGPALFVSPSSFGPAFIALGATLTVAGPKGKTRKIPAEKFFQAPKSDKERETTLKPNEILTDIFVPTNGLRNATYEVRHRQGLDWPYVTATVAFQIKTGMASDSRVVLGHVAPVPWHSSGAGKALNGVKVDGASAAKCGEAATQGAKPLGKNGYKVQLVKAAVKRAVLAAAEV